MYIASTRKIRFAALRYPCTWQACNRTAPHKLSFYPDAWRIWLWWIASVRMYPTSRLIIPWIFFLQKWNLSDVFILSYRDMVLFIKMSQQDAAFWIMELHSFCNLFFIIIGIAVPTAVRTTVIITNINRRHAAAGRTHPFSLNMIQWMLYQPLKLFAIHTESLVNMIRG